MGIESYVLFSDFLGLPTQGFYREYKRGGVLKTVDYVCRLVLKWASSYYAWVSKLMEEDTSVDDDDDDDDRLHYRQNIVRHTQRKRKEGGAKEGSEV